MKNDELKYVIEALLFASERPLSVEQIKQAFSAPAKNPAGPSSGGKGRSASGGKIKVTRIAHGVPVGSALEFVDRATLSRAFRHRQEV